MASSTTRQRWLCSIIVLALCLAGITVWGRPTRSELATTTTYIVQAQSAAAAAAAVARAGGHVIDELSIINAVTAALDAPALRQLAATPGVRLHSDQQVRSTASAAALGQPAPLRDDDGDGGHDDHETFTRGYRLYPAAATGAYQLHSQRTPTLETACDGRQVTHRKAQNNLPILGWGVTVAVIDSGFIEMKKDQEWRRMSPQSDTLYAVRDGRCLVYQEFLPRSSANNNLDRNNSVDQQGHGTHVSSTIADNRRASMVEGSSSVSSIGVAPKVNLLIARALDKDGAGTYSTVIRAIGWVVANQATYNVRVLNLSLYAPIQGPYWADPLNQAVMQAWRAGITVVVAAGNNGPDAGTITVPGNVPYVITVGALKSGRYSQSGEDELANYSSRGPTESAFVKPDVLVPATRTIAPMPNDSTLSRWLDGLIASGEAPPDAKNEQTQVDYGVGRPSRQHTYYDLSGTSMAAAEVSGIVALILQRSPSLTNDQVKYRLLSTARTALDAAGEPLYSVWEQGAGLVDPTAAVFSSDNGAANQGLDIALDLDPNSTTHYWGYTEWDEATGQFRLVDPATGEPVSWSGGRYAWSGGRYAWSGGRYAWSGGRYAWSGSTDWTNDLSLWAGGRYAWSGSTMSSSAASASSADVLLTDIEVKPVAPTARVQPVLECVVDNLDGSYTAMFGYQSDNTTQVAIPIGEENKFQGGGGTYLDRSQPVSFEPGRQTGVFGVAFDGSQLSWQLHGQLISAWHGSKKC